MAIEFDRFNAWLFTDYEPSGSPLRLDSNPLMLFVAIDALWVGIFALIRGIKSPAWAWLLLPLVPLAVLGIGAVRYKTGGPIFEIGRAMHTGSRGEEAFSVYTFAGYDEKVLRDWIER